MSSSTVDKDTVVYKDPDDSGLFLLMFSAFNTLVTVKGSAPAEQAPSCDYHTVAQSVVAACRNYEQLLSRTRKGSSLYRLNTAHGKRVEIEKEVWEALTQGVHYSAESRGCFDITMGSVTQLWDFNAKVVPQAEDLARALEHVDYRRIELFEESGAPHSEPDVATPLPSEHAVRYFAQLHDTEAVVDLGGSAKGYIADGLCALLATQGISSAFVNLGGNVAVFGGKPDGSAWRIGIQSPFNAREIWGVYQLTHGSVVTSGLYERCFELDGTRYHHILSTRTGYPVETDIAGVTVVAEASSDADGYSTTLFALGSKEALAFLKAHPALEGIIITKEGQTLTSSGLRGFTQKTGTP